MKQTFSAFFSSQDFNFASVRKVGHIMWMSHHYPVGTKCITVCFDMYACRSSCILYLLFSVSHTWGIFVLQITQSIRGLLNYCEPKKHYKFFCTVYMDWHIIIMNYSIKCGNDSTLTYEMLRCVKRCFQVHKSLESAERE